MMPDRGVGAGAGEGIGAAPARVSKMGRAENAGQEAMKEFDWRGEREAMELEMGMGMGEEAFGVPMGLREEGVVENVQALVSPSGSSMEEMDSEGDQTGVVDPEPHLSNQFYTFNSESHQLMVECLLQSRYASPEEIKSATPAGVLASWRGVWKDRNEDTAYLTGWKRIQDKLDAHIDHHGNRVLCFKNNPHQYVPHINQWQHIAMSFHAEADLKHLGLKDTIDRIKQVWTVGAKFYGIPESFIRVCIASCSVCRSDGTAAQQRSKRRRFEYTESFELPAREVPQRLQQLAAKHKVVLCIRQKYVRYKPFMAEVKDYCCHRAGEPNAKKPGVLKRKRYSSKRCGCGFRIRAIVPIKDYNQKEKTFSYEDDGKAVFKLYAVHSGHEPGPHEGSARIIHRFVGPANSAIEQGTVCINEAGEAFAVVERDEAEGRMAVLRQVEELKAELGLLEGKIVNMSEDFLGLLSQDLCAIVQRLRTVEEAAGPQDEEMIMDKQHSDEAFLAVPGDRVHPPGLDGVPRCQRRRPGRPPKKKAPRDAEDDDLNNNNNNNNNNNSSCSRSDKWLVSVEEMEPQFDDKSLLVCEDSKLCKACDTDIRHDCAIVEDGNLVGIHVDGYYQDNIKWYEGMSCGLDPSAECGDHLAHTVQEGFRHAIV